MKDDQRLGAACGPFYTWWRGDPLPQLAPLAGFAAVPAIDQTLLAHVTQLDPAEINARLADQHRPYVALVDQQPVAYGWIATQHGAIGELDIAFTLPPTNVYLWDFVTLAGWRGRGIYPHLLQAIVIAQQHAVTRFWIGHAPGNVASARGIRKAGFRSVGELVLQPRGALVMIGQGNAARSAAGAALLGVELLGMRDEWERARERERETRRQGERENGRDND